jgi:hypothetical protein
MFSPLHPRTAKCRLPSSRFFTDRAGFLVLMEDAPNDEWRPIEFLLT